MTRAFSHAPRFKNQYKPLKLAQTHHNGDSLNHIVEALNDGIAVPRVDPPGKERLDQSAEMRGAPGR
jgi:hypothetical protein